MRAWFLHPSGGLTYHARALRFASQWESFARGLATELERWIETQRDHQRPIALVGPSGGYTLPWPTLAKIPKLNIIEPDPIARRILKTRHPGLCIDPSPGLGWSSRGYCVRELEAWNLRYRDHALLFCNLLGQIAVQSDTDIKWQKRFVASLHNRPWLSYHDLFSLRDARLKPAQPLHPGELPSLDSIESIQNWIGRHFEPTQNKRPLYLVDHGTWEWLSTPRAQNRRSNLWWPLRPTHWHLIEVLQSCL